MKATLAGEFAAGRNPLHNMGLAAMAALGARTAGPWRARRACPCFAAMNGL